VVTNIFPPSLEARGLPEQQTSLNLPHSEKPAVGLVVSSCVDLRRFELLTFALQKHCSTN
jgi:hypothetical protein